MVATRCSEARRTSMSAIRSSECATIFSVCTISDVTGSGIELASLG